MARAQNSNKGYAQKQYMTIGTAVIRAETVTTSTPTTLDLSGVMSLTANSTGIVFGDYEADLPGAVDNGVLIGVISNSTGVALFINSTGTVHKYLAVTVKFPT